MFTSPLQRALHRGLAPGGNLKEQLKSLGSYTIRTEADAEEIIRALAHFPMKPTEDPSWLQDVVKLFDQIGPRNSPAAKLLRKRGGRELIRIFDELKGGHPNPMEKSFTGPPQSPGQLWHAGRRQARRGSGPDADLAG
jgi:hypothetical protein